jgi:hypothetical protein
LWSSDSVSNSDSKIDPDYSAFLYTFGLNDKGEATSGDASWPLQQFATRELLATRQTPRELYEKFAGFLNTLNPALKKVFNIQGKLQRGEYSSQVKCFEVGICGGLLAGFSLRLQIGLKRSPLFSYPVIGLKSLFHSFRDGRGGRGAGGIGVEFGTSYTTWSDSNESIVSTGTEHNFTDGSSKGAAFLVGNYENDTPKSGSSGTIFGLFINANNRSNISNFRLQLPIPIYRKSFETPVGKRLIAILEALYSFDFEKASILIQEFNNFIIKLESDFATRGLKLGDASSLNIGKDHPLASPGTLFNPRTVLRYAPMMLPEAMRNVGCAGELTKKSKQSTFIPLLGNGI